MICLRNLKMTDMEFCCEPMERQTMRKIRFSEEQIVHILQEADGGNR